jgi:uncharacterized protein
VTPVRTCMGCGTRTPQRELARMTWRDGALRLDGARRAHGRGGYLHRHAICWKAFVGRRGPVRSLRAAVPKTARDAVVLALGGAPRGEK